MGWDPFQTVLGEGRLFVNATQSYLIDVLDLASGKIVHEFGRELQRIPYEMSPGMKSFISKYAAPKRRYENDIEGLLFGAGRLWVMGATPKEEKRACYDVFDPAGRYLDRVFIALKGKVLQIHGGCLYAEVTDEQDLPALVKYRIDETIGVQ